MLTYKRSICKKRYILYPLRREDIPKKIVSLPSFFAGQEMRLQFWIDAGDGQHWEFSGDTMCFLESYYRKITLVLGDVDGGITEFELHNTTVFGMGSVVHLISQEEASFIRYMEEHPQCRRVFDMARTYTGKMMAHDGRPALFTPQTQIERLKSKQFSFLIGQKI
jgi:hypothetical protein